MKPRKDSADRGAGSGCMARLVRFLDSWGDIVSIILALIVWLIVALFVLLLCRDHLAVVAQPLVITHSIFFLANDERMHLYQRGRASITGLGL
jgi:hypothetical protein